MSTFYFIFHYSAIHKIELNLNCKVSQSERPDKEALSMQSMLEIQHSPEMRVLIVSI